MALVSVVTATWQRPDQLRRAIESVALQSLRPIEHIVVSDGSCDGSYLVAHQPPALCRYVELGRNWRSFRGVESRGADPRMVGAMLARGDYIAYLDDDNEWLPQHLEHAVAHLEETSADFLTTRMVVQPTGYVVGDGVLEFCHVDTNLLVHRAECLLHGNWVATREPADDWDLMRRWRDAGLRWVELPEITVVYHRS